MPSLLIQLSGDRAPIHTPLVRPINRLGRAEGHEIRVADPDLGDGCLVFTAQKGRHRVTALGLTFTVNGKESREHLLTDGDVLRAGSSEVTYSTTASVPGPHEVPTVSLDTDTHTQEVDGNVLREQQLIASLTAVSRTLLETYNVDAVLDQLLDEAIRVTRADKGFLLLVGDGEPSVRSARNARGEPLENVPGQLSDSIVATVLESQQPLLLSNALDDPKFSSSASVVDLKVHSVMCLPLKQKGQLIGLIYVGNDRLVNRFDPKAEEMLTIFAAQASLLIQNAVLVRELQLDNAQLREKAEREAFGRIIGACEGMQAVFHRIEKVAPAEVTVLITGESGTGKELVAHELHQRSQRAKGPFIAINCGAIPEHLIESELFGHVRGAFTGAVQTRPGRFQQADGGTLFLDELGELPLAMQVNLLRALEERVVRKVGATHSEKVDIRVIAATNRDLTEEVREGRFREDLLFRINVVGLRLPPLRDREGDVHLLAHYFLKRAAESFNSSAQSFTKSALNALARHSWPGNVRELENRVKRAVVLADGAFVSPEDLELSEDQRAPLLPLAQAREAWQRRYINEALARNGGNRTQTAKDLGVDPRTIFRHLEAERATGDADPRDDG